MFLKYPLVYKFLCLVQKYDKKHIVYCDQLKLQILSNLNINRAKMFICFYKENFKLKIIVVSRLLLRKERKKKLLVCVVLEK